MTGQNTWILIAAVSYLLGAIPTAWLVGRYHGIDIFAVGSGNMGATNVNRALGGRAALPVALLDVGKGVLAILLARALAPQQAHEATVLAALAATVGHNWSLIATLLTRRLRGGKGAAVIFGALLLIALPTAPWLIVGCLLLAGVLLWRTRYVSLAVLAGIGLALLWLMVLTDQGLLPEVYYHYAAWTAVLVVVRFLGNIRRLLTGTERRFGKRV